MTSRENSGFVLLESRLQAVFVRFGKTIMHRLKAELQQLALAGIKPQNCNHGRAGSD
jgi:hypothetical protein